MSAGVARRRLSSGGRALPKQLITIPTGTQPTLPALLISFRTLFVSVNTYSFFSMSLLDLAFDLVIKGHLKIMQSCGYLLERRLSLL